VNGKSAWAGVGRPAAEAGSAAFRTPMRHGASCSSRVLMLRQQACPPPPPPVPAGSALRAESSAAQSRVPLRHAPRCPLIQDEGLQSGTGVRTLLCPSVAAFNALLRGHKIIRGIKFGLRMKIHPSRHCLAQGGGGQGSRRSISTSEEQDAPWRIRPGALLLLRREPCPPPPRHCPQGTIDIPDASVPEPLRSRKSPRSRGGASVRREEPDAPWRIRPGARCIYLRRNSYFDPSDSVAMASLSSPTAFAISITSTTFP